MNAHRPSHAFTFRQRRAGSALALALAAALVGIGGCNLQAAPEAQMPPPPAVSVAEVLAREVRQWDEFTGHIEAVESVELRPRVSGYIERVNYREGAEVKKGEVLFVIDQRPYRAALAHADAQLAQAKTQAALARSEAARAKKLAAARAISAEEMEQRNAAVAEADAAVRAADAARDVAALDLEFTEVRAPISGRAGRALVTAGNLVSTQPNATVLTTIVSLDPVYVVFQGDEQTYLDFTQDARAEEGADASARNPVLVGLSGEEGYPHTGALDFLDNRIDPATGTITARAVLDNADRTFTPGLFARVKLLGADAFRAVLIDDKAVLTDQDRKYVYVLGPENRALRRDITLGRMVDGLRVVTSGLQSGEQVLVHGVQKVFFPGMPVAPQVIAMGDPPAPAQGPAMH